MEALSPFICHGLKCHPMCFISHDGMTQEPVRPKLLVGVQDHQKGGLKTGDKAGDTRSFAAPLPQFMRL